MLKSANLLHNWGLGDSQSNTTLETPQSFLYDFLDDDDHDVLLHQHQVAGYRSLPHKSQQLRTVHDSHGGRYEV